MRITIDCMILPESSLVGKTFVELTPCGLPCAISVLTMNLWGRHLTLTEGDFKMTQTEDINDKSGLASGELGTSRYIPCQAEPGMFDGEFLVFVNAVDPRSPSQTISVQLLVDREVVEFKGQPARGCAVDGRLRVSVLDNQGGFAFVALPQPAIPVGERMIVRADELSEVAFHN